MKYNFEADNFQLVADNSDSQFATIECDLCRSGKNTHRMPMTRDAIKAAVSSVGGKPILAAFNWEGDDFCGHDLDEIPVGFYEDNVTLVEKDDELYLRTTGKIWKRYFGNVMDIFTRKGARTDVSVEIEVLDGTEPTPTQEGSIDLFSLLGCTLLGVAPAIKGSEARVLSFSEMKDEYDKESQSELEKFSEERRKSMAQKYKINKTELKTTPWGDVDKIAMRNKIMEASNKVTLVKNVYALVEDGWKDAPTEHLKYPLMQLVGDTFYYNRGALSSALAYAKQENEQSVISKVESLYKKFKLDMEDGEEAEMAKDIKKEEMAEEIIEEIVEPTEEVMSEETAEIIEESVEEMAEEEVVEEPTEEMAEESTEEMAEEEPEDEEAEDGDDEEDGEEAEEFSEEKPSFAKDIMQIMECATAEERMACREAMQYEDDDMNIVMDKICAACDKMAELEKFKEDTLIAQTQFSVAEVLASVRTSLSNEDFGELEKMSEGVTFDELDMFKARAKAFAFDHMTEESKTAKNDEVIRMGLGDMDSKEQKTRNVFERILGR